MKADIFYQKMKKIFEESNNESEEETFHTTQTQNNKIIVKPKKQYITANEILTMFGITKEVYNNLLVSSKQNISD